MVMEEKFIFLDRDGVINRDGEGWTRYGYVTRWEDFHFLPGVLKAFRQLKENGYKCVIISNQKCVGKGIISADELDRLTDRVKGYVRERGGDIEKVYYCGHLDEDGCDCRKPLPGMFLKAREDLGIDTLEGKFFVGDSERDMEAGKAAGLSTILVLTGKSTREDAGAWECKPDHICRDLPEAVDVVMEKNEKAGI